MTKYQLQNKQREFQSITVHAFTQLFLGLFFNFLFLEPADRKLKVTPFVTDSSSVCRSSHFAYVQFFFRSAILKLLFNGLLE